MTSRSTPGVVGRGRFGRDGVPSAPCVTAGPSSSKTWRPADSVDLSDRGRPVARQGRRSPRCIPSATASSGRPVRGDSAALPVVTTIAGPTASVNSASAAVSDALLNRDLPGRSSARSAGRHTVAMCSVAPVVRDLPGAVTAGEREPDRHPIVALSATSTEESITRSTVTEKCPLRRGWTRPEAFGVSGLCARRLGWTCR